MRAYFGVPVSPNITETPDGFYICKNVPIARTGWYEYTGEELGLDDKDKIYKVYRSSEEVFKPAAVASFNGKVVTNEHPPEWVTPNNTQIYIKGTSQNIRQSTEKPDLLLADLIIYDAELIRQIQEKQKREVSCGYECDYIDNGDGTYSQTNICGNHIAVVEAGRAGNRVAIKDSKNEIEGGNKKMAKVKLPTKGHPRVTDFLAAMGLKHFATDAEPDDVMEAVDAMAEEKQSANSTEEVKPKDSEEKEKSKDEEPTTGVEAKLDKLCDLLYKQLGVAPQEDAEPATGIEGKVEKLTDAVTALAKNGTQQEENPEKAIDDIISKLEGTTENSEQKDDDTPDEEGITIEPENIEDEEPEEKKTPSADNFYKVQFLKEMKPIVAQIEDKQAKKKACDALISTVKKMKGVSASTNSYASIVKGQKKKIADKQKASDAKYQEKIANLGMEYAKKFNPHYKEVK